MESCSACGLPLPNTSQTCPFCGLSPDGSGSYQLIGDKDGFHWLAGETEVAIAVPLDDVWQIRHASTHTSQFYLISHQLEGKVSTALLNRALQPSTTMVFNLPSSKHAPVFARIQTADGRSRMAMKVDGPTGLHLIDSSGDVVLIGSAKNGPIGSGLDVLIVKPIQTLMPYGIFGVLLAMLLAQSTLEGRNINPGIDTLSKPS